MQYMMDELAVIILTHNESKHLARCLESLKKIASEIYIIDSFSTDDTVAIARSFGAKVFTNKWVNYAVQFQWALNNCGITAKWVMRMDADEYFEEPLVREVAQRLPLVEEAITGIYLKRKVVFKDKWIRYGGFYPHTLLRIWRNGTGSIEQRWMDEHIVLSHGETIIFKEHLVDHNLNSINWWVNKHNSYAIREMVDLLNIKYGIIDSDNRLTSNETSQAKRKRLLKEKVYAALSPGFRASLYFFYRYVIRIGFLDGYKGFVFHFMQGFWYRLLVDVNVQEMEKKIKEQGVGNIRQILYSDYNVKL